VFFEPDEAVSWVIGVGGAKDCGGGAVFAGFGDGLGGAVAGWVVGVDRDFSRGVGDALEAAERSYSRRVVLPLGSVVDSATWPGVRLGVRS